MRAFPLALAIAGLAPAAAPLHAQFSRTVDLTLDAGIAYASPFTLLGAPLTVRYVLPESARGGERERVDSAFAVTTRYRERLDAAFEPWGALRVRVDERGYLEARAHAGAADLDASLLGGVAPRSSIAGRARWRGASLLAGLSLAEPGPVRARLYVGKRWDRVEITRSGAEGLATIHPITADALPLGLPLDRVDIPVTQWRFGVDAEVPVRGSISIRAGADYRIGAAKRDVLQREHAARIASMPAASYAPWQLHAVRYGRHEADAFSGSLSLSWRFGRRVFSDPGDSAVATLLAVPGDPSAGTPAGATALPPEAASALARGDSAHALAVLEEAERAEPRNAAVVGTLGVLLVARASSAEGDFADRARAEELLQRALRLDPGNPRYLLAFGELLSKRGVETDARRVLTRAIAATVERPEEMSSAALADAFYQRGLSLETHVAEFDGLRSMGLRQPPVTTPLCGGSGAFCLNWADPPGFYEIFQGLSRMDHLVADERGAMLAEYRRALELEPAHGAANRRVIGHYARDGRWDVAREEAARYLGAAPGDPWSEIFLGMALVWSGRGGEAEAHFRRGLAGLPEVDREVFEDLRPLLPRARESAWDALDAPARAALAEAYWTRSDPLHLTRWSEREQEHYARVALAELLYGEAQTGRRGWESDRGHILVRYGRPREVWQITRDDALVVSGSAGGADPGSARARSGGGRWVFWNYDPAAPSFIFEKALGFTGVRHMAASMSAYHQEALKNANPTAYRPSWVDAGPIAYQVVRFRAERPSRWDVGIFARLPEQGLAAGARDSVHRGLFLTETTTGRHVVADSSRSAYGTGVVEMRALGVAPGIYRYSIEAASSDLAAAAVERGELVVGRYVPSPLRLSDLLLARRVDARGEAPRHWRDLDIEPLRCLRLPESRRVGVVFELYGLESPDDEARYQVEIRTTGAFAPSGVVRLLRGLRILSSPEEGSLIYERVVPDPGDRVVEWLELEIPEDHTPEVRISIRVTDGASGAVAMAERALGSGACGSGNPGR